MNYPSRNKGFTLIELILGMTLVALAMGSVFATMQIGMDAYRQGRQTMELYQSGRIALQKISEELRLALSPYSFWQPRDQYKQLSREEVFMTFNGIPIEEEDPGAIRFTGDAHSVTYVRKVYHLDRYPPFDLQECLIHAEEGRLILTVMRSLLEIKQASWFYQHIFQVNLNGIVIPEMGGRVRIRAQGEFGEPPLEEWLMQMGDVGRVDYSYVIAEGIQEIAFRYGEDGGWKTSWDSQELETIHHVSPQSPNYTAGDTEILEKGPPLVVEITLILGNGDMLITATDIPAGNMRADLSGPGGQPAPITPPPASNLTPQTPMNETPAAVP
ncbi:MAG: prepilin-type N-terminal cleavage/methylation domain-containing protein [Candidatus Omnitrophica bacterium]|nr:prepilin-type N-terminal cleavage/methylation domain-containing protein [Candidatus Omnitrophota bacterium]